MLCQVLRSHQRSLLSNYTTLARCSITRNLSNAAVASTQATEIPSNIVFAIEKPTPPPRVIKTASDTVIDANGNPIVKFLSFKDLSVTEERIVDGSVFNVPLRKDILHRVVCWQLACRRQGTHKAKSRSETRGSTRKVRAQKGSGYSRVGDVRAPHWRGGYRVHGPVVRDYSYSLQKKVRSLGIRVALSAKLRENKLAIVDSFDFDVVKTKQMKELLFSRGWDDALFIDGQELSTNFLLSTRNIDRIDVIPQHKVNVYSILSRDLLVVTAEAIKYFEQRFHFD